MNTTIIITVGAIILVALAALAFKMFYKRSTKEMSFVRTGFGGEIQLADALNLHAQDGLLEAIELRGKRFDCGSVDGFMSASTYEYAKRLKK